jgi:CheY-like chemotaxis protein
MHLSSARRWRRSARPPRTCDHAAAAAPPARLRDAVPSTDPIDRLAHDLHNAVTAIHGLNQLLRKDPRVPGDLRPELDLLEREVARLRGDIATLLVVARGETARDVAGNMAGGERGRAGSGRSSNPGQEDEAGSSEPRTPTVLVVDDEPGVAGVLARVATRAGYAPIVASSGIDALEHLAHDHVDAVLCDHRMTPMDGLQVHDAAMALQPELAGSFALLSGDPGDADLVAFAEARNVPVLEKPFEVEAVEELLRDLLDDWTS